MPRSLSEKLCWRKAFLWKNPSARRLLALTCDKVTVRQFLQGLGLGEYLTSPFYHGLTWDEVANNPLPERFIVKASHGSTWNHFVNDRKSENYDALRELCNSWLAQRWGETAGEWWYKMATPRILAEEWLSDDQNSVPPDYKIYVSQGKVLLIQVDRKYEGPYRRRMYLPSWSPIDATFNNRALDAVQEPPAMLDKMLDLASLIGAYFDFARVDFFVCKNRLIIGEITHAPASGWLRFSDPDLDIELGAQLPAYGPAWEWDPPRQYRPILVTN